MKPSHLTVLLCLVSVLAACQPPGVKSDLEPALEQFSAYQYGQPKKMLFDTRLAAFRGTDNPALRLRNEQLLLRFVQSDAPVAARREACLWLGELASGNSRHTLEKLCRDRDLADVAQIALQSLEDGGSVTAPPPPASPAPDLLHSVGGVDHVLELSPADQCRALNAAISANTPDAPALVMQLSREGAVEARTLAVRHLGRFGTDSDVGYLTSLLLGGDAALAEAATEALTAMPADAVRACLEKHAGSKDMAIQQKAIGIIAARGDGVAVEKLFLVAGEEKNPNRAQAVRALGITAPPPAFPRLLECYAKSDGLPVQKDWQLSVWDMARRQPDYDLALKMIESTRAKTSGETAATLSALAEKLAGLKPSQSLEHARDPLKFPMEAKPVATPEPKPVLKTPIKAETKILLPGPYGEIVPKRFVAAAYLDCGTETKTTGSGVTIERVHGNSYHSGPGTPPALSVDFAPESLDYTITGIDPRGDYIIGFTWWDSDLRMRRQAIDFNSREVLPDSHALAYKGFPNPANPAAAQPTPARIQFALLPEHIQNGRLNISIRKLAGPNAVNSELWILRRREKAASKQILLVTGQDFPGHVWRVTAPALARILAADPRMEVTICESPYAIGLKHLDYYDAVFLHFKNYDNSLPSTDAMRQNLAAYVKGGGGMCLSHFACGAFQDWPDFVNLAGRVWNGQAHDKRGPFTVKVVDRNHPVTKGLGESFETDDELYFCLQGDPGIHLLCSALSKIKKEEHPQAFVFQPGKGRVFLSTLGHDVRAYQPEGVQKLYRQGTAWAAGLN